MMLFSLILSHMFIFRPLNALNLGVASLPLERRNNDNNSWWDYYYGHMTHRVIEAQYYDAKSYM